MKLKKSLIFLLFSFLIMRVSPDEIDLAKFYLEKAYSYYQKNEKELTLEALGKAGSFSKNLPEYYYISNLLLSSDRSNNHIKRENCDSIIKFLKNNFIVSDYDLLKHCAFVYEKVRDFKASENAYLSFLPIDRVINVSDNIEYIRMLFKTNQNTYIMKVSDAVMNARQKNDTVDFTFYLALSKIILKAADAGEINRAVNALNANNYDQSKILYLKILFFNDAKSTASFFSEYKKLKLEDRINKEYKKNIIYNLLFKMENFQRKDINELLEDWLSAGNDDQRTIRIISYPKFSLLIRNNEKLRIGFLNFSGIRTVDADNDGEWEELYEYNNGALIKHAVDLNQNGINEEETVYFENGKINFFILHKDKNFYTRYNYNPIDQSLVDALYYDANGMYKKETFLRSLLFLKSAELKIIGNKKISDNIEFVETFGKEHVKSMLNKNIILYKEIDKDNNGVFEKRIFYNNGIANYVLIDSNENGYYETYEKYSGAKLVYILYKSNDREKNYDYKEEFFSDRVLKYWDNNNDGIFEILFEEYKNSLIRKKYDLDFDGKYDYVFEYEKDNLKRISRIRRTDGKEETIKVFSGKIEKDKNNNWIVVTAKDPAAVITPDAIFIKDMKHKNGTFIFKKEEFAFKNGEIKTKSFFYILEIIKNQIYLFDNNF